MSGIAELFVAIGLAVGAVRPTVDDSAPNMADVARRAEPRFDDRNSDYAPRRPVNLDEQPEPIDELDECVKGYTDTLDQQRRQKAELLATCDTREAAARAELERIEAIRAALGFEPPKPKRGGRKPKTGNEPTKPRRQRRASAPATESAQEQTPPT